MSELINNASLRQKTLKKLIKDIHGGMSLDEAKQIFKEKFNHISTDEIIQMEQSLIDEGMTVDEVQSLCDVHAAVFDGSISDIHKPKQLSDVLGHPVEVFISENKRIMKLIEEEINPNLKPTREARLMLEVAFERLMDIEKHYKRKENLFFPILEKKGNDTIPKVMWGVDNEIRRDFKALFVMFRDKDVKEEQIVKKAKALLERVMDMVTKENNILMPLLVEQLKMIDWILIDKESDEIGYFLDTKKYDWATQTLVNEKSDETHSQVEGEIRFDAGSLSALEVNQILNTLPLDITFVDKDGHVKYFSQGKERIFSRPKTIIGRHVNKCHPPQSVHVVEEIVNRFKRHEKDFEDFWIQMKDQFVYIRYFAVRDKEGEYLGTLEVTQNIKPLRQLEGEKRIIGE